jgi:hypothetical protein
MRPAFPTSDYYGPSAPSRSRQLTVSLPAAAQAGRRVGRLRNGSHVHHVPVERIGAQLCRYSLAAGTPQTFPDGLPTDINRRLRSRPPNTYRLARTAARPTSTRLEPVSTLKRVQILVHLRYASRSRLPDPTHLAVLDRPGFVRAASRPPLHLQGQAALSFTGLLRQPSEAGLSPAPADMAPRGALLRHETGLPLARHRAASR